MDCGLIVLDLSVNGIAKSGLLCEQLLNSCYGLPRIAQLIYVELSTVGSPAYE